jgi:exonuclease SbcC
MKIGYFTDSHIMGRNPGARIDDYPRAIHKKFLEFEAVAVAEEVDVIVHGGDLFDSPRVAYSILNQYMRILRRLKKKGIRVFLVPGNHDLFGYSMGTIKQTAIGVLAQAGLITLLTRGKRIELKQDSGPSVYLHGQEYHMDIDKDPTNDYEIDAKPGKLNFLFAHGMLLEKPFHPDVRCTLTKDVTTSANLVMCGHYHPGYQTHTIGNTMFCNIGSTGRDEGSVDNINRIPQYAIIETDGHSFDVHTYEFACAEKGDIVFDRTPIVKKKEHVRHLDAFKRTVQDAISFEAFEAKDVLQTLLKSNAIDKDIHDEAFQIIVEMEKSLTDVKRLDGFKEVKKPIAITKIELENFESHLNTTIELDAQGLNALTGGTDSGKSAVVRALRWVFYNEPKGSHFIRIGESRTRVSVTFSNGTVLTRSRTRTSSGEYEVTLADGTTQTFKGFSNDIPVDIANAHQMPRVELAPGIEKALNFSYQLDGHFLLSESPQVRAATIGRLTGVHTVDAAIKTKSAELRNLAKDASAAQKRVAELDKKLEEYADVDEKEKQLKALSVLLANADSLEKDIEFLRSAQNTFETEKQTIFQLVNELSRFSNLDTMNELLQKAESLQEEIEELSNLHTQAIKSEDRIQECKKALAALPDLQKLNEVLVKTETLSSNIRELKQLRSEYRAAKTEYTELKEQKEQYQSLGKAKKKLDKAESLLAEIKELKALHQEYTEEDENVKSLMEEHMFNNQDRMEWMQKIADLVSEMEICPTCNQPMKADMVLQ